MEKERREEEGRAKGGPWDVARTLGTNGTEFEAPGRGRSWTLIESAGWGPHCSAHLFSLRGLTGVPRALPIARGHVVQADHSPEYLCAPCAPVSATSKDPGRRPLPVPLGALGCLVPTPLVAGRREE